MVQCIVGVGRSPESLARAQQLGLIDTQEPDLAKALQGADLVLLAMPVGQMGAAMQRLAPHLATGTVLTDAGSTKQDVVAAARAYLGDRLGQFVPAHPIAGAEQSGPGAARADLFQGRKVIVTPLAESNPLAIERVRQAWQACGAMVSEMAPEEHDRVFAAVSHLPHLLAFGLVDELARRQNSEQLFGFAASGFRDFTRIAGSSPEMWRDICVANRTALLAELDAYLNALSRLRTLLEHADGAALEALFARAQAARHAWAENYQLE